FFFSSRRRHTRFSRDWSSDVCSSDLAPCHLQHAQRVVEPPLMLLRANGSLRVVPLEDSAQCCGSAGIYGLVQPGVAARVLSPKQIGRAAGRESEQGTLCAPSVVNTRA